MFDYFGDEIDERMKVPDKDRSRAYTRYQRRNHMKKRAKQALKTGWYKDFHATEEINKVDFGIMAKTHIGCNKKRCLLCNYSKIFGFPTLQEIKSNDNMKDQLKDLST